MTPQRFLTVSLRSVPLIVVLFWCRPALAQEASDTIPQDLKRQILDLKFVVEDMGGKIESLRVMETATEIRIELAADVLFDFDKADILPKAATTLNQAAAVIREKGKGTVRIDGYTDSKGSDAYNQSLSARRADAVKNWLVAKEGLSSFRFVTEGFGSKRPVAANTRPDGSDDPDGRQKNRRVEIIMGKQ